MIGEQSAAVTDVGFSTDGRWLASAGLDDTVRLWDTAEWEQTKILEGHSKGVMGVGFTSDGQLLASGGWGESLAVWDVELGTRLRVVETGSAIMVLAVRPGHHEVATAHRDGTVRLWSLDSGALFRTLRGPPSVVWAVAFSPDGSLLASGSADQTLRLWSVKSGEQVAARRGDFEDVVAVTFGPSGSLIASGAFSPSGDLAHLWNTASLRSPSVLVGSADIKVAGSFDIARDGSSVVFTGPRGALDTLALPAGTKGTIDGVIGAETIAMSPDGARIVTVGGDQVLRVWDTSTGRSLGVLGGHDNRVNDVVFSPDARVVVSSSADRTIRVWDVATGRLRRVLRGHKGRVNEIAFADAHTLVSVGHAGELLIWELDTGRILRRLTLASRPVERLSVSADGRHASCGGWDGRVLWVDLQTMDMQEVARCQSRVASVGVFPDGERIAVACAHEPAQVVDLETGAIRTVWGAADTYALRLDPQGRWLVTLDGYGALHLWDQGRGDALWDSPMLLEAPPTLLSHRGWTPLAGGAPFAPSRWAEAVEARAIEAVQNASAQAVCLVTEARHVERWDQRTDRRVFDLALPVVPQSLVALAAACVVLGDDGLVRVASDDGSLTTLEGVRAATALAPAPEGLLIAGEEGVSISDVRGSVLGTLAAPPGAVAVVRVGPQIALGYPSGELVLVGDTATSVTFEMPPILEPLDGLITAITAGPQGTVVASHEAGVVGVWDTGNGRLLHYAMLRGSPNHLVVSDGILYAASDLGDHLQIDLRVFTLSYCDLIRQLWTQVPAIWRDSRVVAEPPSSTHRCAPP